jgi:seryl-tRNA synthetase
VIRCKIAQHTEKSSQYSFLLVLTLLDIMLSLDFVYQHPQVVREALRKRRDPRTIDGVLRLAGRRRELITRRDAFYATLKKVREEVQTTPITQRTALNEQIKEITKNIRAVEVQRDDIEAQLQIQLLALPNLPHASVPEGEHAADDREVRRWGEAPSLHFKPLAHWELGRSLNILDAEGGVKIAGSRFVALRGVGARLERALIAFMLDVHTREHGYTEIMPPQLVKRSVMIGAGQLPGFEDQAYACSEDALYLNPTAEVPLVGLHSDEIIARSQLPLRYAAWTRAFRREAGSSSRLTRGLLRLHEFNKIELFQIVEPQTSYTVQLEMLQQAESILQYLELPYRVVELCTANLPFTSAKTFDLQVWMPGLSEFVEISSISNCEAFQARRANIKYRPAPTMAAEYVHTLNASGLAVGRTMAAILENYQQADGSLVMPKVLRPYVGMSLLTPPRA